MDSTLARVREYCEEGRYLQAYEASKPLGPFATWTGVDNLVLAGRLAVRLGAMRLGMALHRRAFRRNPEHVDARYYFCFARLMQFGPLCCWRWMNRMGEPFGATPKQWGDWFGLRADVCAMFRDFDRAEHWIARALEVAPDDPFVHVQRSNVLLAEDDVEGALEAVRHAMRLSPWYRPAVEACAHYLAHMNRDEEAIGFLLEACERLDAGSIRWQLALLYRELGRDEDARRLAESLGTFYPLMDKSLRRAIHAMIASSAYRCSDMESALRWAQSVEDPKNKFFVHMRRRLEDPTVEGARKVLPVDFVRQHHDTCAPATLSALSAFWGKAVDHDAVAAEICYGGTPSWRGRLWAENQGFVVREFRLDWDTAVAIIDRGVPVAMEVAGADWSHIQALVGYDSRLRTFLIRDSNHRVHGEALADELLKDQRAYGPRGLLLIPPEELERIADVVLPEVDFYDDQHAMQLALERHDREAAAAVLEQVEARAPGHRMTLMMRWILTSYDQDLTGKLHSVERLAELYPENARLAMSRLNLLVDQGRRDSRLQILREKSRAEEPEYVFWQQYAAELLCDAREHPRAEYWLRRAIRANPTSGVSYGMLSTIIWERQQREEAYELNRVAACLEATREQFARNYFTAAVHLRREEEALELLRSRFQRFLRRSGGPATTLSWAYVNLARAHEAHETLELAMRERPEDGELLLHAAQHFANFGHFDRSDAILEKAKPVSRGTDWLRVAARISQLRGEPERSLSEWREVARIEPLAVDAHDSIARLLNDMKGIEAAVAYLEGVVQQFPHHCEVRSLYIHWLGDEDPTVRERALRELLELNPADPESRERLALVLRNQNRLDEAMDEARRAFELDPRRPTCWMTMAMIHEFQGEIDRAKELCREALRLSVDFEWAIDYLIRLSDTLEERREGLHFIQQELTRQATQGDAVLSYSKCAEQTLEPDELLDVLRQIHQERPDLWHAWSALVRQLCEMQHEEEALRLAHEAVERFPLLPRLWLDLAIVCRRSDDLAGERDALERALRISPNWPEATRELAEAHQRAGNLEEARAVLRQALVTQPGNCANHAYLADVLWESGEREAAIEQLRVAVRLDPGYRWAWDAFQRWSGELEQPQLVQEAARELVERRPHEPRSWFILADMLDQPEDRAEAKEALRKAIQLHPVFVDAYQLLAYYHAEDGEYEAALNACHPAVFGDQPPWDLRVRAAQVEAQRGNVPEAIEQLKAALDDNPNSFAGWQRLADLYCESRDVDSYHEACQQMVRIAPEAAVAHGYLGDSYQMLGRPEEAAAAFQHAISLDSGYYYAAECLYDLYFQAQDAEGLDGLLETMRESAPLETLFAWRIGAAVVRSDRATASTLLADLASMESENPRWLGTAGETMNDAGWGEDVRQVLHAALDDCGAEGRTPPFALLVVAAHEEAAREELPSAIALMRQAVTIQPDFQTGWRWLSVWTDHAHDLDGYLQATRNAVQLDPRNGLALACVGDAHLQRGGVEDALAVFAEAVELSPDQEYCVTQYFDRQLAIYDFEGARSTIDRVRDTMPPSYVLRLETRLAAQASGLTASRQPLERLCQMEGEIEHDLLHAVDGLILLGGKGREWEVLDMLRAAEACNPGVATVYVQTACRYSTKAGLRYLQKQAVGEEAWCRGLAEFIIQSARQRKAPKLPRDWSLWTPKHPRIWGAHVLWRVEQGDFAAVDRIPRAFDDEDADVVGLLYLAIGLRGRGDGARAVPFEQQWRGLASDYRLANHSAWLACQLVQQGRWVAAASWLRESQPEHMSHFHKALYRLAHTMLQLFQWMPQEFRPKGFGAARRFFDDEIGYLMPMLQANQMLRRIYFGCLARMAQAYRRPLLGIWYNRKS